MSPLLFFFTVQSLVFLYWLVLLVKPKRDALERYLPSVTVLIPAYNEENRIRKAIESVLSSDYPSLEVIVIDDGSTDGTYRVARSYGVKVVRTPHVGKARALNEGVKHATGEVIVVLDADTRVERDSLRRLVAPLKDERTVISVGKMKAEGRGLLAGFQRIEYAFVSEILYAHSLNGKPLPFFFGAFMAIKRRFLDEVGGFASDTPGEDFDLFIEAMERGYRIRGTDALAFTEVPEKLVELFEQRLRWGKAGVMIALKHRKILHKYPLYLYLYWPVYGLVGFPHLFGEFLKYIPWHLSQGTLLEYLLSWTTFLGPLRSLCYLPVWGFSPLTVLGVMLGILSLVVISWAWWKNRERNTDVVYLLFLPLYGTFLMGVILFLVIPYTLITYQKKAFIR